MSPGASRRVDFFIAGVQKGGTTALDAMLRTHPAIQMAHRKEPHFFDRDNIIDWNAPDYEGLESQFDWSAPSVMRGEATPIYIYWPQSLERIRRHNAAAKLVIALRHPAFRAFSHWRMEIARRRDSLPFAQAVGGTGRRRVADAPGGVHRVFSYVERGLYARQIERLLSLFPRSQLMFLRTDELWHDPQHALNRLCDFLAVESIVAPERRYVTPVESGEAETIPQATRAYLDETFASDIAEASALAGTDLSDWLDPSYDEPMARPPGVS